MNAVFRLSLLIFEAVLIIAAAVYFSLFFYARLAFTVIAIVLCVRVFASDMNFAYKNLYALLLVAFPCLGVFFYIFTRVGRNYRAKNNRLRYFTKKFGKTAAFITSEFSYPVCKAENFRYHADGEAFFSELFKAISRAEKFIFLQFFIVKESRLQLKLFDLLKRKAALGVEIKFLYDGFGAMFFERKLKIYAAGYGFEAKCFNPAPGLSSAEELTTATTEKSRLSTV